VVDGLAVVGFHDGDPGQVPSSTGDVGLGEELVDALDRNRHVGWVGLVAGHVGRVDDDLLVHVGVGVLQPPVGGAPLKVNIRSSKTSQQI
jgi:hypothetical protein